VADQKRPNDFIVARYREATEAMTSFLESGASDDDIILQAIAELNAKSVSTEFQEQDRDLSIEALESFLDMADSLNWNDLSVTRGESNPPQLTVAGVNISVRPELVLRGRNRQGDPAVGPLKLYLSKTHPLTREAGEYIGVILQQFASEHLTEYGACDYRLCQTLDVFSRNIFLAPRTYRRRQDNIEAACQEIARAWSLI